MGKHNGPYNADFPTGTQVQIKSRAFLEEFHRTWKWHNPLNDVIMEAASQLFIRSDTTSELTSCSG
jgi:hypothetical protein